MADKKILTEGDSGDVITTDPQPASATTYAISDFVKAAKKMFGHTGALVDAALRETDKDKFTVDEAKAIVHAFANQPVTR